MRLLGRVAVVLSFSLGLTLSAVAQNSPNAIGGGTSGEHAIGAGTSGEHAIGAGTSGFPMTSEGRMSSQGLTAPRITPPLRHPHSSKSHRGSPSTETPR